MSTCALIQQNYVENTALLHWQIKIDGFLSKLHSYILTKHKSTNLSNEK